MCRCVPVVFGGVAPEKRYFGNLWEDLRLCQRGEAMLVFSTFSSKNTFCLHDFRVGKKSVYILNLIMLMYRVTFFFHGFSRYSESSRSESIV